MLKAKTRWEVERLDEQAVRRLAEEAGVTPLLARLLVRRGVQTASEAAAFLNPLEQSFHDPFLLDGMERAIQRLKGAIDAGERVLVYGDYDADGVCSTSVMVSVSRRRGRRLSSTFRTDLRKDTGRTWRRFVPQKSAAFPSL
ncbi:Single-stranded-DNA-specific exonuclease RecJ [Geobacillus sp. BCO2]|nr:Single-stranded-DNA-specific exonuclease RecJ [Geobacillus sp. BCO2]